jgi:hypothetical protein
MKKILLYIYSLVLLVVIVATFKSLLFPPAMVPAYFVAPYEKSSSAIKKLKKAGFTIVSKSKVGKKKMDLVIFTHPEIEKLADQDTRGFLYGALRLLVNKQAKEVRISNPNYILPAFLQDQYKDGQADTFSDMIATAFPKASYSKDQWAENALGSFQYMLSMPTYQDVSVLAEGDVQKLVNKLDKKVKKKKKSLVFKHQLSENRFIYGIMPGKRTSKFVDKIGSKNALALPWMILIENNRAVAFDGKYYIALSYPLLSLDQFMTIATVPGAIEKDMKKLVK